MHPAMCPVKPGVVQQHKTDNGSCQLCQRQRICKWSEPVWEIAMNPAPHTQITDGAENKDGAQRVHYLILQRRWGRKPGLNFPVLPGMFFPDVKDNIKAAGKQHIAKQIDQKRQQMKQKACFFEWCFHVGTGIFSDSSNMATPIQITNVSPTNKVFGSTNRSIPAGTCFRAMGILSLRNRQDWLKPINGS